MAIDYTTVELARPWLAHDERVVWTGRPETGIKFRGIDFFLIPFSMVWAGFAFFWEAMVLISGAPIFMAIFGIPFVLVGFQLLVGRFFSDAKRRQRTHYLVTDRRAMVIREGKVTKERSFYQSDFITPEMSLSSSGKGDVKFGMISPKQSPYVIMPFGDSDLMPLFEMTDDPKGAVNAIQKIRELEPDRQKTQESEGFWEDNVEQDSYQNPAADWEKE